MANRKMRVPTDEEYRDIIKTVQQGYYGARPNPRIAFILQLQATLCLRIGDILLMTPESIIRTGDGQYRLDIIEEKTGKTREFKVPTEVALKIREYAVENEIKKGERLFPLTERAILKHLSKICDYLDIRDIGTHSFRKYGATSIYYDSGKNIRLVQQILQHSSVAVTERYIGIQEEEINEALEGNVNFVV